MKSKRIARVALILLMIIMLMCGCGKNGISQEEYDRIVKERDNYKAQLTAMLAEQESQQETQQNGDVKTENDNKEQYEDIFFYDLIDNIGAYNGRYVRTTVKVYTCHQTETESYIQSEYSDYDLIGKMDNIKIYPDNYQDFQSGEYITVEGRIAKKENSDVLVNAHIIFYGIESEKEFEDGLSKVKEQKTEQIEREKEEFLENAQSPSYDDLMRYPDSYKEMRIKVKVKIVRVEPDGIIFDGDIEATLNGETVALYDGREIKEPKLREGDSVTIYGCGKGTTTVKVQDISGWIPKTVDKYDIPAIDIKYIIFD